MTRPNLGHGCTSRRNFQFLVLEIFETEWFMSSTRHREKLFPFHCCLRDAPLDYKSWLPLQLSWPMFESSLGTLKVVPVVLYSNILTFYMLVYLQKPSILNFTFIHYTKMHYETLRPTSLTQTSFWTSQTFRFQTPLTDL